LSEKLTRRGFLKGVGALVGAGLLWRDLTLGQEGEERDLLFIINNGDASVSVIDTQTDEVLKTFFVGTTAVFPANKQYKRGNFLITGTHLDKEPAVHIVDLQRGELVKKITTGSAKNYTETTPDGKYVIVAARLVDRFLKVHLDPEAPSFGEVTDTLRHLQGAEPCDMALSPDGRFAFIPDIGTDTFSVVDVENFEVIATVPVPPLVAEPPVKPFMTTASRDGKLVFQENREGKGTVSVFDVSDPYNPKEVKRFTQEDGLGIGPVTDEFTLDGEFNFIINRDSSDLTVVRLSDLEIIGRIELVREGNPVTGDFSIDGTKFYVPIQNQDVVAVVDVERQKLIKTIGVGPQPVGAVSLRTQVPPVEGVAIGSLPPVASGDHCPLPCCGEL